MVDRPLCAACKRLTTETQRTQSGPERFIVLFVIALLTIIPTYSQTREPDLDRVRGEITRMRQRLNTLRNQAESAERQMEEADIELGLRTRELQLAVDLQVRLEIEQQDIQRQVTELAPRLAHQKAFLKQRLVALYRLGNLPYLRILLSIDRNREPLAPIAMLTYVAARDSRAIVRFESMRKQLVARSADLTARRERLQTIRRTVEERRSAVAAAHREQQRVLASLRSQESGSEKHLAALEEKARRLERLVGLLAAKPASMPPGTDIFAVQGALIWPIDGKVVEGFGRQREPKFGTVTMNNGIRIAAAPGTAVRAVFQGTVLFRDWFRGYGNLIIVDHGHRVVTLYGNLKAPSVAVGDRVAAGQSIAGAGEGEEAQSGHLYFELRRDNRPEDPQKWLR